MAILIGIHNQEKRVHPLSGPRFSRDEIQSLLECLQFESIFLRTGRVLIWNESSTGQPVNHRATEILSRDAGQTIYGPALLAERKELEW